MKCEIDPEAIKLNLGCGRRKLSGDWVNVDKIKHDNVDVVHDLNIFPYPFKDDAVEHIIMNHVLEHLNKPYDVLLECYRILKTKGIIDIIVPHKNHLSAYDIAHKNLFTERSMCHLTTNGISSLQAHPFYKILSCKVSRVVPTPIGYIKGFNLYKNAVGIGIRSEIYWKLEVVK